MKTDLPRLLAICVVTTIALSACGSTGEPAARPNGTGGASGSGGAAQDAGNSDAGNKPDAAAGSGGATVDAAAETAPSTDLRADSTGPGLTPEEAMKQFFAAYCAKTIMCCPPNVVMAAGGDLNTCKDLIDLERQRLGAAVREGALSGRLFYDGVGMTECVRKFNAAACPTLRAQSDPTAQIMECDSSIKAKVPLGMACADDVECIDSWCDADAGSKCVAKLRGGGVCGRPEACVSDNCSENGICSPPDPPGTVTDGLCG